jgi:alanyl-tRNA synthetase
MPAGEPGGPDSEVFYDFGTEHDTKYGPQCHPNCDCGRFLEIGNSVFMEYLKRDDGTFGPLPKPNVDFGGGLERITMAVEHTADIVAVNHKPILAYITAATGKVYGNDPKDTKAFRVVADHVKAAVFLIGDGVYPSNTDQGYFVRRLIRRAVRYADLLGFGSHGLAGVVEAVVAMYEEQYPELRARKEAIETAVRDEETKFRTTIERGLREFDKLQGDVVSGADAFTLFSTYGFPLEMTVELAQERSKRVDVEGFRMEMEHHQELSRAGSVQKFKGGLADASEVTTMLHSCTHLMLAGLRKYLGDHVHQAGSNITQERTRFDFTHGEKVSREVLDKVEVYVNDAIQKRCIMTIVPMKKEDAHAQGVEGSFWEKYPDEVTVYQLQSDDGTVYSRELCGGPHVQNTKDIIGTFKIIKEEASSAGVRRVKGVLVKE